MPDGDAGIGRSDDHLEVKPKEQVKQDYDQLLPFVGNTNTNVSPHREDGYSHLDANSNGVGLEERVALGIHVHHYDKVESRESHCNLKHTGDCNKTDDGDATNEKSIIRPEQNTEHSYDRLQHLPVHHTQGMQVHANSDSSSNLETHASTTGTSLDYDYIY